jgi:hypothetical protein
MSYCTSTHSPVGSVRLVPHLQEEQEQLAEVEAEARGELRAHIHSPAFEC